MDSPFFFHTKEFVYRNDQSAVRFESDGCSIYFSVSDKKLISLPKSTFGSFDLVENVSIENIRSLVNQVIAYAERQKCESVEVKCYPEIFSKEKSSKINEAFLKSGFTVKYNDTTQILFCDKPLDLDLSRKRRLAICAEAGFTFDKLSKEFLSEAYDLFLQSRNNKGYPITMQLNEFISAFDKFPDQYGLYGVRDKGKLIAASVVVRIDEEILYYFFAGDDLNYRKQSPSTFLICNLFEEAIKLNYRLIDLGISTDKGILNKGLYDFKKSFGAIDSPKLTFEKKL
ncbi:MAG: GNAT family N-acetyltransferase [Cyclobacteriaceae bacterium]